MLNTDLLSIRTVTIDDLPALEWGGEYTHFRRLYASAFQRQSKGLSVLWVAEIPAVGLIGQAFVQLKGSRPELADGFLRGYIYSVRVRTAYRNQGFGSKIMLKAEDDLRQRGFSFATLNVEKRNPDARRLYERLGYAVVAQEPGVWSYIDHRGRRQHVHEPAWRMQKKLR